MMVSAVQFGDVAQTPGFKGVRGQAFEAADDQHDVHEEYRGALGVHHDTPGRQQGETGGMEMQNLR
jgi:hypothetical protein